MQHCLYAAFVFILSVNCLQAEDRIFSVPNLPSQQERLHDDVIKRLMKRYEGNMVVCSTSRVAELKDPLRCRHKRFFCLCDSPFASNRVFSFAPAPYDHTIVRICDVETGEEWVTFEGLEGGISYAAFMPNGNVLTASGGTVRSWDTRSGKELHRLEHPQAIRSVIISSDGKKIVTLPWNHVENPIARIWDAESGKQLQTFEEHIVAFAPDMKKFVTADFRIWDVELEEEMHKLDVQMERIDSITFSPDGTKIVAIRRLSPYSTKIWDAESGEELLTLEGAFSAFSPDGKKLITRNLRIWDVELGSANFGRELQKLDLPNGYIEFVAFLPDGEKIVTVSYLFRTDPKEWLYFVEVWDTESGEKLESNRLIGLSSLDSTYNRIVLSPNGTTIATVGGDKTFRLWCVQSGTLLQKWTGYEYYGLPALGIGSPGISNSIAFSPDGTKVVMWGKEYHSIHW
ncbi:MAG: hypothetical protein FWE95_01075 [Planctomycetaceae bacterium]|nr:hypothetical protein [Planctomycetaceae bacterium]